MHHPIRTILSMAITAITFSQTAYAGGFSLYTEGSAAEIGNFAAGAAAEGADASIGLYNPAGLVLLHKQQVVFSGVGVFPSSILSGESTYRTDPEPDDPLKPYSQHFTNIQGGKNALVPAMHYAKPLGQRATFGLSMTAPFGLSTDWGQNSRVRYQATLTELKTINISPELGGLITDHFSVGAGIDFQWAQVKFNRVLGSPAVMQDFRLPSELIDSQSYNQGHSFGVGFHAGVLGMFNDNHSRLGLNYQSQVKHQFHGYSLLTGPLANFSDPSPTATFRSNSLSSNTVALPDMTTLSAYQDINEHWALLGSVIYTGWNSFKTIQLNEVAAVNLQLDSALVNSISHENYKNAWRFAVGANYHFNEQWMLRFGGGYDQTPTTDAERNVRLPDANRWALSIGGHYQVRPAIGLDVGYTYLWAASDPLINRTDLIGSTSSYNVNARADVHAHLVGAQVVWAIDHENLNTK